MLYRSLSIRGIDLLAKDGRVGKIKDLYFDDHTWIIRCLSTEDGTRVRTSELLPAPGPSIGFAADDGALATNLTLKQIAEIPKSEPDLHLRGVGEITGYRVTATNGELGPIDDVLIELETWRITHLVADTGKWWLGKHAVVDQSLIDRVDWLDRRVVVGMTREAVKASPAYQPEMMITDAFQCSVSNYYGRLTTLSSHRHHLRLP